MNIRDDRNNKTAFRYVCENGHTKQMKMYLQHGYKWREMNEQNDRIIFKDVLEAYINGYYDLVKEFFRITGTNVDSCD
jgi:hypothetical protein